MWEIGICEKFRPAGILMLIFYKNLIYILAALETEQPQKRNTLHISELAF